MQVTVYQKEISPDLSGTVVIENSDWAPGLYMVRLETSERTFRAKLLK